MLMTKEAMDKFAFEIGVHGPIKVTYTPGRMTGFVMDHYKKLIAGAIGAYALSKIIPAVYNVSHTEKDERLQEAQAGILQNILANQYSQMPAPSPARDNYQYVF